jgi:hypothetical protein
MYIVIITSYGKQAGVYTQLGNDSTKTISTLESIHYATQLTIFTRATYLSTVISRAKPNFNIHSFRKCFNVHIARYLKIISKQE